MRAQAKILESVGAATEEVGALIQSAQRLRDASKKAAAEVPVGAPIPWLEELATSTAAPDGAGTEVLSRPHFAWETETSQTHRDQKVLDRMMLAEERTRLNYGVVGGQVCDRPRDFPVADWAFHLEFAESLRTYRNNCHYDALPRAEPQLPEPFSEPGLDNPESPDAAGLRPHPPSSGSGAAARKPPGGGAGGGSGSAGASSSAAAGVVAAPRRGPVGGEREANSGAFSAPQLGATLEAAGGRRRPGGGGGGGGGGGRRAEGGSSFPRSGGQRPAPHFMAARSSTPRHSGPSRSATPSRSPTPRGDRGGPRGSTRPGFSFDFSGMSADKRVMLGQRDFSTGRKVHTLNG